MRFYMNEFISDTLREFYKIEGSRYFLHFRMWKRISLKVAFGHLAGNLSLGNSWRNAGLAKERFDMSSLWGPPQNGARFI